MLNEFINEGSSVNHVDILEVWMSLF